MGGFILLLYNFGCDTAVSGVVIVWFVIDRKGGGLLSSSTLIHS